jgi:hypothetical protein
MMNNCSVYKLEIFCPEKDVDPILEALARAHAGEIGNYDHCATISSVGGTYRPLTGSDPSFGEVGELTRSTEFKIEVNCLEEHLVEAIQAVRKVHSYEEPVINVIPLANLQFGAAK